MSCCAGCPGTGGFIGVSFLGTEGTGTGVSFGMVGAATVMLPASDLICGADNPFVLGEVLMGLSSTMMASAAYDGGSEGMLISILAMLLFACACAFSEAELELALTPLLVAAAAVPLPTALSFAFDDVPDFLVGVDFVVGADVVLGAVPFDGGGWLGDSGLG